MHHPTDRIAHTTAFVTPVVEHWLEQLDTMIFKYIFLVGLSSQDNFLLFMKWGSQTPIFVIYFNGDMILDLY